MAKRKVTEQQLKNLIPFKPGQSGNPNGRPRKSISATITALDDAGIKATTKKEVTETYLRLMNCTQGELEEVHNDPKQSMMVKIVASNIADKKGFDILEKMLDRSIGRPQQDVGLSVKTEIVPLKFVVDDGEDLF